MQRVWRRHPGSTDPAAIASVDIPFRNSDANKALSTYDSSFLAQQPHPRYASVISGSTTTCPPAPPTAAGYRRSLV
ncbi:hypothetical protein OOK27_13390 [Streptomyces canus]|uniref:hypothetical protein n=1 Tax=Streptomyces canus TaxID=58343 RepID=UPI0022527E3C|nr:hypothetical protein [Streptomyces canus]MCX5255126.1 hypothetical protein [Streptomyces canus]